VGAKVDINIKRLNVVDILTKPKKSEYHAKDKSTVLFLPYCVA
jgi:hypothetical protein